MRLTILLLTLVSISTAAPAFHYEHMSEHIISTADNSTISTSPPISRGEMLYKNHCQICHESNVHIRKDRKAKSIKDILYWVTRWSSHLKLNWSAEDKQDVVHHLNEKYYNFSIAGK